MNATSSNSIMNSVELSCVEWTFKYNFYNGIFYQTEFNQTEHLFAFMYRSNIELETKTLSAYIIYWYIFCYLNWNHSNERLISSQSFCLDFNFVPCNGHFKSFTFKHILWAYHMTHISHHIIWAIFWKAENFPR